MKRHNQGWLNLDLFGSVELEQMKQIVECAPNVLLADRSGCVVLVNAQLERMFGHTRQELPGQPVEILIPPRFRGTRLRNRTAFFANPSPRAMGAGGDLYGLHKDGHEFPSKTPPAPNRPKRPRRTLQGFGLSLKQLVEQYRA